MSRLDRLIWQASEVTRKLAELDGEPRTATATVQLHRALLDLGNQLDEEGARLEQQGNGGSAQFNRADLEALIRDGCGSFHATA